MMIVLNFCIYLYRSTQLRNNFFALLSGWIIITYCLLRLTDWLTDWMTAWLPGWLTDWMLSARLPDWANRRLNHWSIIWFVDQFATLFRVSRRCQGQSPHHLMKKLQNHWNQLNHPHLLRRIFNQKKRQACSRFERIGPAHIVLVSREPARAILVSREPVDVILVSREPVHVILVSW